MSTASASTTSRSKNVFATAPAAFFTSLVAERLSAGAAPSSAVAVDGDLQALHIRVSPQPWERTRANGEDGAEENEIDLPDTPLTFHSDPADDDEKTPPHFQSSSHHPSTVLQHSQLATTASTQPTLTQLPISSPLPATSLSTSSSASSSSSSPSLSPCKVLGCGVPSTADGYCAPHRSVFQPTKAAVESDAVKDKRERREKKSREAQLAVLREKTTNSLTPSSPPLSSTSSSPSHSPSWFSRPRKSSAESKADDDDAHTPPSTDALLTLTRRAWRHANAVVSKDVPRLAKRMSVIDDKRVCVLWGRRVGEEEVSRATKPRPSLSHSHSASNPGEGKEQGKDREGEGVGEASARLSSAGASFTQPQLVALDAQSSVALPPDPPSPKSRVTGKEVMESQLAVISTWAAVSNVVLAVAEHLETPQVVQRLRDAFARSALAMSPQSDLELQLSSLFTTELGPASPTFAGHLPPLTPTLPQSSQQPARPLTPLLSPPSPLVCALSLSVFRACHQSILFPAVFHLKTRLYASVGQMKDVRRHDGWTVEIYVGDGRVWITHTRTEQSLEAEDDPAHFECSWEIRLSFDREMLDCRAVFLRILQLTFHPQMQRERREHVIDVLRGNGYIV